MYLGKIESKKVAPKPVSPYLKHVQGELFRGGYYAAGSTRTSEVDGLYGSRTQAAVKRLQADLMVAGVYEGPVDGKVGPALDRALSRLKKEGMPQLPAGVTARLTALGGVRRSEGFPQVDCFAKETRQLLPTRYLAPEELDLLRNIADPVKRKQVMAELLAQKGAGKSPAQGRPLAPTELHLLGRISDFAQRVRVELEMRIEAGQGTTPRNLMLVDALSGPLQQLLLEKLRQNDALAPG